MSEFKIQTSVELEQIASFLKSKIKFPTLLFMEGDLGSGKTALTKYLAAEFGLSKNRIKSPTFTLINCYRLPDHRLFYHLDLYRLEHIDAFIEENLLEIFTDPSALIVIEWPEKIYSHLEKIVSHKKIKIKIDLQKGNERVFTIEEL